MTKKVYIAGLAYRDATKKCFLSQGSDFEITDNFKDADLYVFTGGEDINPRLYNQRPLKNTHFNLDRDSKELEAFSNIPDDRWKIGICRGAQLLNVLAGGSMWQDVDRHQGGNHVVYLQGAAKGLYEGDKVTTNSIHHQMMIPGPGCETLGYAHESTFRENAVRDIRGTGFTDSEVLLYKQEKSFCFQAHPEFGHAPTTELFFKLMKRVEIY